MGYILTSKGSQQGARRARALVCETRKARGGGGGPRRAAAFTGSALARAGRLSPRKARLFQEHLAKRLSFSRRRAEGPGSSEATRAPDPAPDKSAVGAPGTGSPAASRRRGLAGGAAEGGEERGGGAGTPPSTERPPPEPLTPRDDWRGLTCFSGRRSAGRPSRPAGARRGDFRDPPWASALGSRRFPLSGQ